MVASMMQHNACGVNIVYPRNISGSLCTMFKDVQSAFTFPNSVHFPKTKASTLWNLETGICKWEIQAHRTTPRSPQKVMRTTM